MATKTNNEKEKKTSQWRQFCQQYQSQLPACVHPYTLVISV